MIIVIQRYHIVLEEIITEYSSSNKAVVNYVYIKIGGSVYTNLGIFIPHSSHFPSGSLAGREREGGREGERKGDRERGREGEREGRRDTVRGRGSRH